MFHRLLLLHLSFLIVVSAETTSATTTSKKTPPTIATTNIKTTVLKTQRLLIPPLTSSSTDNCDVYINIGAHFHTSKGQCVHKNRHYNCTSVNSLRFIPKFEDRTCIRIYNNLTSVPLAHVINFVDVTELSIASRTEGFKKGMFYNNFIIVCKIYVAI